MTATIYAWPPVRARLTMLAEEMPIRRSVGAFSGQRYVSSAGPRRRLAQVDVSALAGQRMGARDGAGLSLSLARLLDGGVNLVRLPVPYANWCRDAQGALYSAPMTWTNGGSAMTWTSGGSPMLWFSGPVIAATATTDGGFAALSLSGLTPGALVCRAFDVVQVYVDGVLDGTSRAVASVWADASGAAVVRLFDTLASGLISIGGQDSAVFEAVNIPRAAQGIADDWVYSWTFREVLAAELTGEESEVDPWA